MKKDLIPAEEALRLLDAQLAPRAASWTHAWASTSRWAAYQRLPQQGFYDQLRAQ